jgi:DNA-binding CsgD family transcriptional regulator
MVSKMGVSMKFKDVNKLTPTEEKFYNLSQQGLTRRQIADQLGVNYNSVVSMLKRAQEKVYYKQQENENDNEAMDGRRTSASN